MFQIKEYFSTKIPDSAWFKSVMNFKLEVTVMLLIVSLIFSIEEGQ
jgi:hypothetical protein